MTRSLTDSDIIVGTASTVLGANPVVLHVDDGPDLHVRVSAPASGEHLPVVLLSHGFGSSGDMYQPLAEYYAAHGFLVLQPTYRDSRTLGGDTHGPQAAQSWRRRYADAVRTLDGLATLEAAVPGLTGRVDHDRIAAVGHSFGGQTSGLLLGLRVQPPAGDDEDLSDPRVSAGVLLSTAGLGGESLSAGTIEILPWLNVTFEHLTAPALVVYGDQDDIPLSTRGPEWSTDPYYCAPPPKDLLGLAGAQHSLGGAVGYDSFEITDANPATVYLLQRATTAYLRTTLGVDPSAWPRVKSELRDARSSVASLESK